MLFTRIAAERQLPLVSLKPNAETLAELQELENDDLDRLRLSNSRSKI